MHLLSVGAPDRPGLVAGVSAVLHEHGCSIHDLSLFVMQGYAPLACTFRHPHDGDSSDDELAEAVRHRLAELGMRPAWLEVVDLDALPASPADVNDDTEVWMLNFDVRIDAPGVIHKITEVLFEEGLSIMSINARVEITEPKAGIALTLRRLDDCEFDTPWTLAAFLSERLEPVLPGTCVMTNVARAVLNFQHGRHD